MYEILRKKRHGLPLTDEEIRRFVADYTAGIIPDYQASALCMAICLVGMDERESATLTDAMLYSGDTVDLSRFGDRSVDKHSTGGVGDKTTPIVAPLVASLGGFVAKMSGRGLGHTGGTIDKLEAIPGYRTTLTKEEFLDQVGRIGLAVIGQSGNLVPADKKLYALRDVTATVDSAPLIASSIMSKKLASGAHSIVLDVKVGSGAFMKNADQARALATLMVKVGRACGRRVSACLSDMDRPLGFAIGNACEMEEAAAVLRGEGPADLREVSLALSAEMLSLVTGESRAEALFRATAALDNGTALITAERWITAQGGNASFLAGRIRLAPPSDTLLLRAEKDGYLIAMNAEGIGSAATALGAGRKTKEDQIDPSAGILLHKKPGDFCREGDPIATLETSRPATLSEGERLFRGALAFGEAPLPDAPLILGRIS